MNRLLNALSIALAGVAASFLINPQFYTSRAEAQTAPMMEHLGADDIADAAKAVGATNIMQGTSDGVTFVAFELNGVPHVIGLQLCDVAPEFGKGCLGALMMTVLEASDTVSWEKVNTYNMKYPVATAGLLENKEVALTRFLFTAGGIGESNIALNIALFGQTPGWFVKHVNTPVAAVEGSSDALAVPLAPNIVRFRSVQPTARQLVRTLELEKIRAR